MTAAATATYEFDDAFQLKVTALALRDTIFHQRTEGLIEPGYLAADARGCLVDLAQRYYRSYKKAPDFSIMPMLLKEAIGEKRIRPDMIAEVGAELKKIVRADLSDRTFVIDKVAEFARQRAVEKAILESVHLLEKGEYAKIEEKIRQATTVGAHEDVGDAGYFKTVESRTAERVAMASGTFKHTGVTTGYPEIDRELYHLGWGRRELSLIMGGAKAGKSISLWDFAKNASFAGHNVLGTTHEITRRILLDRIDANVSDTAMKALKADPATVAAKVKAAELRSGAFQIHEFASGACKVSQIHRLIERYRTMGILFDLLVVDYADLLAAERWTDDPIANSKSIYTDLRAIGFENDLAVLSATQTNRDGAKASTPKMTDVAEDFNKIRIADIVISIAATDEERSVKEARLFWAASRNTEDHFTIRIRQDREKMKFITKVLGKE